MRIVARPEATVPAALQAVRAAAYPRTPATFDHVKYALGHGMA